MDVASAVSSQLPSYTGSDASSVAHSGRTQQDNNKDNDNTICMPTVSDSFYSI